MYNKSNFTAWLTKGLSTMKDEHAYCLNIYDDGETWTCELSGTDQFYKDGNTWYYDETKVSNQKPFSLTNANDTGDFRKIFAKFASDLKETICGNTDIRAIVNGKMFGYGFTDGDLYFIDNCDNEPEK